MNSDKAPCKTCGHPFSSHTRHIRKTVVDHPFSKKQEKFDIFVRQTSGRVGMHRVFLCAMGVGQLLAH